MGKKKYFVSYCYNNSTWATFGNAVVDISAPIKGVDEIRMLENELAKIAGNHHKPCDSILPGGITMSASRWSICPRCKGKSTFDKPVPVYGKVSEEEFLEYQEELSRDPEYSLRENYSFELEDMNLVIEYCGCCSMCGFTFTMQRSQSMANYIINPTKGRVG